MDAKHFTKEVRIMTMIIENNENGIAQNRYRTEDMVYLCIS